MLNNETVFPDKIMKHRIFDDIPGGIKDGTYLIGDVMRCNSSTTTVTIKDNKLISSSGYHEKIIMPNESNIMPHMTWYFEYDDLMSIYKEKYDDGLGKRLHGTLKSCPTNVTLDRDTQINNKVKNCTMENGKLVIECENNIVINIG
jgi:hypothetical protein